MAFIVFELIFTVALIAGDLLSKHYVEIFWLHSGNQLTREPYTVIEGLFQIQWAQNNGAGFSIMSGKRGGLIAVAVLMSVMLLAVVLFMNAKRKHHTRGGRFVISVLLMAFAGGVGNLVDRCRLGYVRDFIRYPFLDVIWEKFTGSGFPICNVADIYVTVAMVLLVVYILFFWKEAKPEKALEPDDAPEDTEHNIREGLHMWEERNAAKTPSTVDVETHVDTEDKD